MNTTYVTRWLYANLTKKIPVGGYEKCALCGCGTSKAVKTDKVFRDTFTDYQSLRAPSSKYACEACAWYMDNMDLRKNGWIIGETFAKAMNKSDWFETLENHIENGMPSDAYYLIRPLGLTGKHLAPYAPLNLAENNKIVVRWNVSTISIDEDWLSTAYAAYELRKNHSWREIIEDNYITAFVEKWNSLNDFIALRKQVIKYKNTPHLDLIAFCYNRGADNRSENIDNESD